MERWRVSSAACIKEPGQYVAVQEMLTGCYDKAKCPVGKQIWSGKCACEGACELLRRSGHNKERRVRQFAGDEELPGVLPARSTCAGHGCARTISSCWWWQPWDHPACCPCNGG